MSVHKGHSFGGKSARPFDRVGERVKTDEPSAKMTGMVEFVLEIAGVVLFAIGAVWLGVETETLELIVAILIAMVGLWFAARSAYREACRRQRWPGKNREKRRSLARDHESVRSSPSATNR
jgi:hypothetical protein